MLVDNAVVVMENIFRHREEGDDRADGHPRRAPREVSLAVIAATLTSVIVFLPLIFNKPSEMNIYLKELGDHGLPDAPRVALHQPDADSAGDLVVHQVAAEAHAGVLMTGSRPLRACSLDSTCATAG